MQDTLLGTVLSLQEDLAGEIQRASVRRAVGVEATNNAIDRMKKGVRKRFDKLDATCAGLHQG